MNLTNIKHFETDLYVFICDSHCATLYVYKMIFFLIRQLNQIIWWLTFFSMLTNINNDF